MRPFLVELGVFSCAILTRCRLCLPDFRCQQSVILRIGCAYYHARCVFWHAAAIALAAFPVGAVVSLMQVRLRLGHGDVQLMPTQEAYVTACVAALAGTIRADAVSAE